MMRYLAVLCLVLALVAGGLLAWGLAIGAGACYAGILGAAICASLFASVLRWWQRRGAGGAAPVALDIDPRGKNPRTYVLEILASVPCKVVIQFMVIGIVLWLAVSQWLAVLLGFLSLLVAIGAVMAVIAYFNAATKPQVPDPELAGTPGGEPPAEET